MRTFRSVSLGAALMLCAGLPLAYEQGAASYPSGPPTAPGYYAEAPAADPLDQLMAPIALYPDPLISLILPAAAFPSDIAAAGAYLSQGGDPAQADTQPWDPSVRALAHYPSVVIWMSQNGPWTQTVGAAFVSQPSAVMTSIQRLRAIAHSAGTLTSSPQQQVVVEGGYVEIEPAQPGVIYVPRYDPAVVFVDQPYYGFNGPFFTYGPAYAAGAWLTFGCNWQGGGIMIVDAGYWHGGGGWWHPYGGRGYLYASANFRSWSFPSNRPMPRAVAGWQGRAQLIQPRLGAGIPRRPPPAAFRNIRTRGPAAVAAGVRNPSASRAAPLNHEVQSRAAAAPARHIEGRGQGPAARPSGGKQPGGKSPQPAKKQAGHASEEKEHRNEAPRN